MADMGEVKQLVVMALNCAMLAGTEGWRGTVVRTSCFVDTFVPP